MTWLVVAIGAAVGAVARDRTQTRLNPGARIPYGTLLINLVGAFLLGLAVALQREGHISKDVELLVGVGFCGSLTTWSGVMWEWRMLTSDGHRRALGYLGLTIVVGTGLAALGLAIG